MKINKLITIALGAAAIALVLRLPNMGNFMTVDEENWMLRSALFYNVLRDGNPGGTFVTTHPGATAMWLIGGGETIQQFRLGFPVHSTNLAHFRKAAVFPVVVATAALIGLITYLALKLFGTWAGSGAGLLLAADPYLIGSSQIAHLDALQALLMLGSLLSFLLARKKNLLSYKITAGALLGLAMGVKLILAIWLLPVFALIILFDRRRKLTANLLEGVRIIGFVFGVGALIFYAIWPALWVKDDISRSLTRDVTSVITQEHVSLSNSEDPITPWTFYARTVIGRSTPFVQLLTLGALLSIVWQYKQKKNSTDITWVVVYAIGFLVIITLAAKKADRYAMPTLVSLQLLAGWAGSIAWLVFRRYMKRQRIRIASIVIISVMIIMLPILYQYPIAYNNPYFPNIRPLSQQGWGEGLDAAAQWLNQHPFKDRLSIASWYPSVMRTYFQGQTFSLSSRDDFRVGYVVTYRNMGGRALDTQASDVLDEMKDKTPAHTISIGGVPYVWIYETINVGYFTKHVGEIIGETEVGQTIFPDFESIHKIEIGFANYSSRNNTEDVVLNIRDNSNSTVNLRTIKVNARDIVDNEWREFNFIPLVVSPGQSYYVAISSPTSIPGNAVTVRFAAENILPGDMILRRHALQPGESNDDYIMQGDLAIRIPKI